jgi:hypothetical protein
MSDQFDPYHQWLGIPPDQQPPNHYRLLGLKDFEDDRDVIVNAAHRQMAYVRTFQNGPNVQASQDLLNEIARAKTVLLEPSDKEPYDLGLQTPSPPAPPIASKELVRNAQRQQRSRTWSLIVGAAVIVLLIATAVLVWQTSRDGASQASTSELPFHEPAVPNPEPETAPPTDLLEVINPVRDATRGTFALENGVLVCEFGKLSYLTVPIELSCDYRLTLSVQKDQEDSEIHIDLPVVNRKATVVLDGNGMNCGLAEVAGKSYYKDGGNATTHAGPVLSTSAMTTVVCEVVGTDVNVSCDGNTVIDWTDDSSLLPLLSASRRIGIGNWNSGFRVSKLEFIDLTSDRPAGSGGQRAIWLNGASSYIQVPHVPLHDYEAFTIETWIKDWQRGCIYDLGMEGDPENEIWMHRDRSRLYIGWEIPRRRNYEYEVRLRTPSDWQHIAFVFSDSRARVLADGRLVKSVGTPKPGPFETNRPFFIGVATLRSGYSRWGHGLMRSFRVSKVARYQDEASPKESWEPDADTLLLLDAWHATSGQIPDQSGHERHATLFDGELLDVP